MLIVFIADAEVIDYQCEIYGSPHMLPVAGGMAYFIVSVLGKSTFQ